MAAELALHTRLRQKCVEGLKLIEQNKLETETFKDISDKLNFVINSYDNDKNPIGLFEIGEQAHKLLSDYKQANPRKLNKRALDNWSKVLKAYSKTLA